MQNKKLLSVLLSLVLVCTCIAGMLILNVSGEATERVAVYYDAANDGELETKLDEIEAATFTAEQKAVIRLSGNVEAWVENGVLFGFETKFDEEGNRLPIEIIPAEGVAAKSVAITFANVSGDVACANSYTFEDIGFYAADAASMINFYAGSGEVVLKNVDLVADPATKNANVNFFADNFTANAFANWEAPEALIQTSLTLDTVDYSWAKNVIGNSKLSEAQVGGVGYTASAWADADASSVKAENTSVLLKLVDVKLTGVVARQPYAVSPVAALDVIIDDTSDTKIANTTITNFTGVGINSGTNDGHTITGTAYILPDFDFTVTIKGGTFVSRMMIHRVGAFVGDLTVNIEGGKFDSAVITGRLDTYTTGKSAKATYVVGDVTINVSGGDFNKEFYGPSTAAEGMIHTGEEIPDGTYANTVNITGGDFTDYYAAIGTRVTPVTTVTGGKIARYLGSWSTGGGGDINKGDYYVAKATNNIGGTAEITTFYGAGGQINNVKPATHGVTLIENNITGGTITNFAGSSSHALTKNVVNNVTGGTITNFYGTYYSSTLSGTAKVENVTNNINGGTITTFHGTGNGPVIGNVVNNIGQVLDPETEEVITAASIGKFYGTYLASSKVVADPEGETVPLLDAEGNPTLDEETQEPVTVTKQIITYPTPMIIGSVVNNLNAGAITDAENASYGAGFVTSVKTVTNNISGTDLTKVTYLGTVGAARTLYKDTTMEDVVIDGTNVTEKVTNNLAPSAFAKISDKFYWVGGSMSCDVEINVGDADATEKTKMEPKPKLAYWDDAGAETTIGGNVVLNVTGLAASNEKLFMNSAVIQGDLIAVVKNSSFSNNLAISSGTDVVGDVDITLDTVALTRSEKYRRVQMTTNASKQASLTVTMNEVTISGAGVDFCLASRHVNNSTLGAGATLDCPVTLNVNNCNFDNGVFIPVRADVTGGLTVNITGSTFTNATDIVKPETDMVGNMTFNISNSTFESDFNLVTNSGRTINGNITLDMDDVTIGKAGEAGNDLRVMNAGTRKDENDKTVKAAFYGVMNVDLNKVDLLGGYYNDIGGSSDTSTVSSATTCLYSKMTDCTFNSGSFQVMNRGNLKEKVAEFDSCTFIGTFQLAMQNANGTDRTFIYGDTVIGDGETVTSVYLTRGATQKAYIGAKTDAEGNVIPVPTTIDLKANSQMTSGTQSKGNYSSGHACDVYDVTFKGTGVFAPSKDKDADAEGYQYDDTSSMVMTLLGNITIPAGENPQIFLNAAKEGASVSPAAGESWVADKVYVTVVGADADAIKAVLDQITVAKTADTTTRGVKTANAIVGKAVALVGENSLVSMELKERIYIKLWIPKANVVSYFEAGCTNVQGLPVLDVGATLTENGARPDRDLGWISIDEAYVAENTKTFDGKDYVIVLIGSVAANDFNTQIEFFANEQTVLGIEPGAANTMLTLAETGIEMYKDEAEVKDLFTALYNYGASACGEAVKAMDDFVIEDAASDPVVGATNGETAQFTSVALLMGDAIGYRFNGKLAEGASASEVIVKVNGAATNNYSMYVNADGSFKIDVYVSFNSISADIDFEITVNDATANVESSLKGYSEKIATSADPRALALAQLVQAVYNMPAQN